MASRRPKRNRAPALRPLPGAHEPVPGSNAEPASAAEADPTVAPAGGLPGATAGAAKSATGKGATGGYDVSRPLGKCSVTGETIEPGEKFHAALRETPTGLQRWDVKLAAWPDFVGQSGPALLASWLTTMPMPGEQKKKLFVDDDVLLTLFERLGETAEPGKIRFRFVLGLILMRKRLVTYDSQRESPDGQSIWSVKVRGKPQQPMDLVNPHLTEQAVGEVSAQLGEVLSSEF